MRKLLFTPLLLISLGFGETIEPAGAPPADLNPAIAGVLQKDGIRVLNDSKKVVSEIWFRSNLPSGPKSAEDAVTLPTIPSRRAPWCDPFTGARGRSSRPDSEARALYAAF